MAILAAIFIAAVSPVAHAATNVDIPEPGSLILLGSGLLLAAKWLRPSPAG